MVDICVKLLDMSHKHVENPVEDVSSRCDPVYVGRVVSAMVGQCPRWTGSWMSRKLLVDVRLAFN